MFKFNPLGPPFDLVNKSEAGSTGADNFSYNLIADGAYVEIPDGQQMLFSGHVRVLGHLLVSGVMLDMTSVGVEQFFYDKIDDVVVVESNRLLLYKDHLSVDGHLRVKGRLAEV